MLLIGTLFGIVTFGVLTANIAQNEGPCGRPGGLPDGVPAHLPDHRVPDGGPGGERCAPGHHRRHPDRVRPRAMRDLMLTGYDWDAIGLAFLVILGLGLLGLPLTIRNYRAVYR
jgi:hypothetical protein